VNTGLTPISGSSITLFAAGATGYGAGATAIGTATTAADGTFTVTSYTCPAGNPQTYITASGGDAGSGGNSAIGLMAALGPCNSLTPSTNVTINELTTAATQWALAQFFDSSGHNIGTTSTNATGLINAYAGFADLAALNASNLSVSGNPSSFLPSGGSCPGANNCDGLERLNTLANILAGCDESSGSSSSACAALLCDATPGLTYSSSCSGTPIISDTLGAAELIVTNPSNNVSALYGLAAVSTPFSPGLATAPDGWEMALNFTNSTGAGFSSPHSIAVDASGNVFAANLFNSVSELTAASGYATGLNLAPSGAMLNDNESLALDGSGNIFVLNLDGNGNLGSVGELTAASSYATGLNFNPAGASFASPTSLALDGSGNIFVVNQSSNSVSELTAASSYGTGLNFAPSGASLSSPVAIALDGFGNIFASNSQGPSLSELTVASGYSTGFNFPAQVPVPFGYATPLALDGSADLFSFYLHTQGELLIPGVNELTAASSYTTSLDYASSRELNDPDSIALDGSGNVFALNEGGSGGSVSELTAASGYATVANFNPAGASFSEPLAMALDGSGNVFVANPTAVSEILGLAKPVITPIQSCLIYWSNHPGQACLP
jgi:hypothetical protein